MKLRPLFATATVTLFATASAALAAVPVVNTFTVAATAVSPVPVVAFTATDSDGNLAAYMCTDSNTKPSAGDSRWSATPPASCATTRVGSISLYGWAKDSAGGVSNSKAAPTNVVGTHNHDSVYVNESQPNSVNGTMIVDGAVTNDKILGPISASKIDLVGLNADTVDGKHGSDLAAAVHSHGQSEVSGLVGALNGKADAGHGHDASYVNEGQPGSIDATMIAEGAVTDAKIAGPIDISKMAGTMSVDKLATYSNVRVVHKGPADGEFTFNSISAAVTAASALANASNPYTVLVMPGVYEDAIWTRPYVTIKGLDRDTTIVTYPSSHTGLFGEDGGTLALVGSGVVEGLTIENTDPGNAIAASAHAGSSILRNCRLVAGTSVQPVSHATGLIVGNGNVMLYDCEVLVSSTGHAYGIKSNYYAPGATTPILLRGGDVHVQGAPGHQIVGIELTNGRTIDLVGTRISSLWPVHIAADYPGVVRMRDGMLGEAEAIVVDGAGIVRLANTLIPASVSLPIPGVTVTNCFDENYQQIQSQ